MPKSVIEQENESLKERIKLALLGYNAGIYEWNMLDDSAYYSDEWLVMLGLVRSEIKPHLSTWRDLVHPDDINSIMQSVQKTIEKQEKNIETVHRLKHKNGEWIWILGRGLIEYNAQGKPLRMTGIHTNITQQKEQELKVKRLAQMIEQTHESVIFTDLNGKILSWNKGSELLFGYSYSEVIGKKISFLLEDHTKVDFEQKVQELLVHNRLHTYTSVKTKNSETLSIDLALSIYKDDNGVASGIIVYSLDITDELKAKESLLKEKELLNYMAHHDQLTKLPNRTLFQDRLERSLLKSKRNQTQLALFFIDLDHFKEINDKVGHDMGDAVLQEVSKRILNIIREEDTLARIGGDEFILILEDVKEASELEHLATKILQILKKAIVHKEIQVSISSSIGISLYPRDAESMYELVRCADKAMYRAKEKGRNSFEYYSFS